MALGRHCVSTVKSTNRHRTVRAVERITTNNDNTIAGTEARGEMDSHADTCVAGPNFVIIEYTGEHCDVTPYSDEYKPFTDVPIVNASTAYTDPETQFSSLVFRKYVTSVVRNCVSRIGSCCVSPPP